MKNSSSTILALLGGVALGFAAAHLLKNKKVEEVKDSLDEKLHKSFMSLHNKVMDRHEKWLAERSKKTESTEECASCAGNE